jgi:hypothetical protein
VKRVVQRYLIASVAFAAAAAWFGVSLVSGFVCLLASVGVSLAVGVVQRRQLVAGSGRARRTDTSRARRRPLRANVKRERRSRPRPAPRRVLYDDEAQGGDWPQLADYGW